MRNAATSSKNHPTLLLEAFTEGYGLLVEHDGFAALSLNPAIGHNLPSILREGREQLFTDDRLLVHCILQKADTLNRNGRVYPLNVLQRENGTYQQAIAERAAVGECNHPDEITMDLHNLSHLVTKTWWEGAALMGELEILVSPQYIQRREISPLPGDKIAYYLEKGIKLGISSRGLGSVKKLNGKLVVQNDFGLICFDLVQSPSTPGSFLHAGPGASKQQALRESAQTVPLVLTPQALLTGPQARLRRFTTGA